MKSQRLKKFCDRLTSRLNRAPIAGLICAAALLLGVALAWAQTDHQTKITVDTPSLEEPVSTPGRSRDGRLREGTVINDQLGHFRMAGDRVTFFTEDGEGRFVVLENLNLERIARVIADNPDKLQWSVTGMITEYGGANFMLLRRATLKNQTRAEEIIF